MELLTTEQVARELGVNRETVRIMMFDKKIPGAFQLLRNGAWRISREDFEKWIKARAVSG